MSHMLVHLDQILPSQKLTVPAEHDVEHEKVASLYYKALQNLIREKDFLIQIAEDYYFSANQSTKI